MGLFTKKIGPVFLKDTSDADQFIEKLEELLPKAGGELKKEIETQIKFAKYGRAGEQNIAFELKSSGMDMFILHDIYLEFGELSAQIDYIVITRKRIYVIECKNLIGNIEIDDSGNFIRSFELSGKKIRERMYSPITQNQRHLQVIRELCEANKGNVLKKALYGKNFDNNCKSLVVLANPKTVLYSKYAKKEVKQQVIHADQLVQYLRDMDAQIKDNIMSEGEMKETAQFFLEHNQPERSDYSKKYVKILEELNIVENTPMMSKEAPVTAVETKKGTAMRKTEAPAVSHDELVKKLKEFRLSKSQQEKLKPYYIFNDAQMEDLIAKNPKTKEELLNVSGFGSVKIEKYGNEILKILGTS